MRLSTPFVPLFVTLFAGCAARALPQPDLAFEPAPEALADAEGARVRVVAVRETVAAMHVLRNDFPDTIAIPVNVFGGFSTVGYFEETPTCFGPFELVGTVVVARGGDHGAAIREAEPQIVVKRWECLAENDPRVRG